MSKNLKTKGIKPKKATVTLYHRKGPGKGKGTFAFKIKAANGENLDPEGYTSPEGAVEGIKALARAMANYKVIYRAKPS